MLAELQLASEKVDHIAMIIQTHENQAAVSGAVESVQVSEMLEAALRLNSASLESRAVQVLRQFSAIPAIQTERHKVLQILVNLIANAGQALEQNLPNDRRVTLGISPKGPQRVSISVADNGKGIAPENLPRMFQQGFSTRPGGHGLGLHSSANLARQLGGSLRVDSQGPSRGATFILDLPLQNPALANPKADPETSFCLPSL